jgi:aspartate carbamoyltransferase catalytic subunit
MEKLNNIISSKDFDVHFLNYIFKETNYLRNNQEKVRDILKNKIVALIFYEPSTRTRFSFESAALKLGATCISTENGSDFSSSSKGETIEDTVAVLSSYADFLILRHSDDNSSQRASKTSRVPLINAGSGMGEHPTQALLDAYTIFDCFKKLKGLNIAIVGDLLRGRTCDSLVYLLSKFPNNTFYFISHENSKIKPSLKSFLEEQNISFFEEDTLENFLPILDVCYMTRIQKERFEDLKEYELVRGKLKLNSKNVHLMKSNSIIMHPLPRVDEISKDLDLDARSTYFKQAENGLYVRMALLKYLHEK